MPDFGFTVNVAAINYDFGSKDELIDKAVEAATASAFEKIKEESR